VGAEKALTEIGNVIMRVSYGHERDQDPVSGLSTTDKLFKADVRLLW
jgi:hypothetical protein